MFGTVEPPPATPVVKEVIVGEVVVLVILEVVVPPRMMPPVLLDVAVAFPVAVPPIVPVHFAFVGQQATWPASSRAQSVPVGQHTELAPRLEHAL